MTVSSHNENYAVRENAAEDPVQHSDASGMIRETRGERRRKQLYAEAKAHFDLNGNLHIPYKHQTQSGLRQEMRANNQRRLWKKKTGSGEQHFLLKDIGLFNDEGQEERFEMARAV